MNAGAEPQRVRPCADYSAATTQRWRSQAFRWLKALVVVLVGLGAFFLARPALATQITFSTAENTARLYTLTAADLASYDPGGTFGIYDDTVCDTGTIATLHGGTANIDGGSPDTIYYTPPAGYIGSDTVTFFNTTDGVNCVAQQAIVTVYGPLSITTTTLPVPVYLVAYSQTIATTGGLAPITFSRIAGVLPSGVALSSAGLLHGTPSAGAYSFTIRALDANANQSTQAYSGTVAAPPMIATATLPTPVLNVAYNHPVTTTGGTAPIAFSISSGSLPAGLSINSSSGVVSGTPTAAGAYSFTLRALDANSLTGTHAYSGTIAASLAIATATLSTPVLNFPYSQTVATTGGTAPITLSVTAGALPAGLTLNSTSGVVSGTPTAAGAYSFTVHAVDANSTSADQTYSGTIEMTLLIATTSLPTPVLGQAYSLTVTTTGGTAPITFGLNNGTLPTGLTISSSGVISGTPSTSGSFSFTIYAADATTANFRTFNVTVAPSLTISTTTLPTPLLGVAYSQAVTATGGTAPITFSVTAGALPAGLIINASSGVVSGTPAAAGAYSFTVRAVDASSTAVDQVYSGTIVPSIAITNSTLPTPLLGVPYSQIVATTGGTAPITFSVTAGALPAGLSISSSGVVSGTPPGAGAYSFTVHAVDANSISVNQAYSGTIVASLAIATTTLPAAVLGQAYSQSVTTTGGTTPIAFALSAGTLPTGLMLDTATGAITGTPTTAGAYTFTIRATDANAIAASQAYSGTISASLAISTATLPTPVLGVAYSGTVATTGGTAPIAFAITTGTLPTGLTLNTATGAIGGTPTAAGAYAFTIRATDTNSITASQTYSGTIGAGLAISSATLPTPVFGVAYSATVTTTGGTAPISFSITTGTLPTGLTLSSTTGVIGGTSTAAGAYTFTIRANDANAIAASQTYSGTIGAGLAISSAILPTPVFGVAYSGAVTTTGGTAPIAFSITTGTLPAGLTLNTATGAITGTPTSAGAYAFTIRATDANSITASQAYSGTIGAGLAIASATLPTPVIGVLYSQSITTTGGTAPIAFAVTTGTLPTGLTLNTATGALSGTPTAAGAYAFTVRATDANSITASQAYSGTIGAGLAISNATLSTPVIGVAYSGAVTTTGGTAPITFAITTGTLPTGLTLNAATGAITGTPTAAGAYTFTIRATDANAINASQAYSGTIGAGLAISSATLPPPVIGVPYSQTITTTGGTAPISFSITTGTLPTGLTLNTTTGTITGTPTAAGAYTFTIRATDANAITASQTNSGTIGAGLAIASATLPTPVIGVSYDAAVTTTGGTLPITFAISSGSLPSGLSLSANGTITGTATTSGAYVFTVRATDAHAITASRTYSGTIGASLAISSATLPTPLLGAAYNGIVTTIGGTAPISFAIATGTLPSGLTLNSATGAITGTPTLAGTYTFTVRATDANAMAASRTYSGTIAATLTIGTATLPTPVIGVAYDHSITTTGGTLPIAFSITAGTLPAGLSLNTATGALSGTPTTAGAYTFTIRAVDAAAQVATQTYSGTIGAVPSLAAISPNSGPTAGGTSVTITGTAFTGATAVMFGSTPATSFSVVSATSIVATSPAGSGSEAVSVVAPGGTTRATAGATFTWAAPPAVTSISPDSGPFAGGTVVTITGRGFTHATAVYFGSVAAATFSVTSDTSISATTAPASANATQPSDARKRPASATLADGVTVSVVTAGGTSPATPAGTFVLVPAVVPVPTVARLSPASGTSAGGTSVTITGTGLSSATAVRFGAAVATFTVTNSTSIIALAPAGAGTVQVTVTTPGGTSAGSSAAYIYTAAATAVGVTSSSNPAPARTPVTFTATVTSAGTTPTGSVRFKDGATVIGTVALAGGVAELTTSALAIGTHAIAADYGGNARLAPSTSPALAQAIDVPADSQKLRALQLAASKIVAQASGQAISSAIDNAISDGFSGNRPLITPSTTGIKINVAEAGSRHKVATEQPVGVPGTPTRTKSRRYDAASPPNRNNVTKPTLPREWLVWADVQRTGITHTGNAAATTLYGDQINALAGVTRRVSPNVLVGVLGGYETFDYRSDALAGRLNGNGTTVGAYLGWKFVRGLRFDLAGAHTGIGYDGVAGTAAGAFVGSRWLVSSGLIGTYDAKTFAVEPSAKVYALHESQSAYIDSLGTPQATSTFTTGRASAGAKISTLPKTTNFMAPYAGFYADYYFNGDNAELAGVATTVPLAGEKILAGWSARAVAGFAARLGDATTLTCEAEYGGIGSNTRIVKYRCAAGLPIFRTRSRDK